MLTLPTFPIQPHTESDARWSTCRYLTCSVLPVRMACNLQCPFCFSKSSISALRAERVDWDRLDVERYYAYAVERGATRLVITGGGEPLLRPDSVRSLIERGRAFFSEIACFTNGSRLTAELANQLQEAGLSYLCYSRHHHDDQRCRELMGSDAPHLDDFFRAAASLRIRATCVMTRGWIESTDDVDDYITTLSQYGVSEYTFKHTYIAYSQSVFGQSTANMWSMQHQVDSDPFATSQTPGEIVGALPWGPVIRRRHGKQVCFYYEPDPQWELENQRCRSLNLLSDGTVYGSLEDQRSLLFRLKSW